MAKVAIVKVNGEVVISDTAEQFVDYQTLSTGVGGMIQHVEVKGFDLWCNENGIYEGLEVNPLATKLWMEAYPTSRNLILGDVVLTGGSDEEGETLGLSDEQINLASVLTVA